MRGKHYQIHKNKFLLDAEYAELERILEKYKDSDVRNVLLIELALRTGGRAQEILNLTKANLDHENKSILIEGIKGSNDREIPIRTKLFERLASYVLQIKSERLFPISYSMFREIWRFYRPVNKKLHCLRHTFAIRVYEKRRDLKLVQVGLGHRNIQNTMVYADYVFSKTELKRLII